MSDILNKAKEYGQKTIEVVSRLSVAAGALVMASALVSGLVKINFNHHHNMPGLDELATPKAYVLKCGEDKTCHVYLKTEIQGPDAYVDVEYLLDTSGADKTIYVHLRGHGGAVEGAIALVNAMRNSEANVVTVVEGPVYSAHAFLAMAGKQIIVRYPSSFMFHIPANGEGKSGDAICDGQTGVDRGQDVHQKCLDYSHSLDRQFEYLYTLLVKPYLTDKENEKYHEGWDVYVQGNELAKRIHNGGAK
jgi:hypothetical protein